MIHTPYNRTAAVIYAQKWAFKRNPDYYDFEKLGGDCTNFASQCIYAGTGKMNHTKTTGWYYRNLNDRSPSWTSVEYLYSFLTGNTSVGPVGHVVTRSHIEPGDLVQLGSGSGTFYHTSIITRVSPSILVAAHSYDALNRPLSTYTYGAVRFIHIDGVNEI